MSSRSAISSRPALSVTTQILSDWPVSIDHSSEVSSATSSAASSADGSGEAEILNPRSAWFPHSDACSSADVHSFSGSDSTRSSATSSVSSEPSSNSTFLEWLEGVDTGPGSWFEESGDVEKLAVEVTLGPEEGNIDPPLDDVVTAPAITRRKRRYRGVRQRCRRRSHRVGDGARGVPARSG
jgi:hypothetical protein